MWKAVQMVVIFDKDVKRIASKMGPKTFGKS